MQSNVHILEICIQSCYGKILLSCGIHLPGNISSGPYFTEAVAVLRKNKQACSLLGEPVRVKALKLGMRKTGLPSNRHRSGGKGLWTNKVWQLQKGSISLIVTRF